MLGGNWIKNLRFIWEQWVFAVAHFKTVLTLIPLKLANNTSGLVSQPFRHFVVHFVGDMLYVGG